MTTPTLCLFALLAAPVALAAPPEPKEQAPPAAPRPEGVSRLPTGYRGIVSQVYVGEAAPGFELRSAEDKQVKLSSFAGDRVLLCFSDRRETLSLYREAADSLRAMGVYVVGIARDSPRSLRTVAQRDSLPFMLLSDPTGEISAIYGSYDFATRSIRPGYVLVDRMNIVRMVLLGQKLPPGDLLHITQYALTGL
ncbi:MAG: peroxiredoxin family protein [Candidatus Eiseniibacteriota bacterium]